MQEESERGNAAGVCTTEQIYLELPGHRFRWAPAAPFRAEPGS
jgi:hypothetical protein